MMLETQIDKLKKLLALTTSDNEHEALAAMRHANKILKDASKTWADVIGPNSTEGLNGFRQLQLNYAALFEKIRMGIFGLKKFQSYAFAELPFVVPIAAVAGTPNKVKGLDGWPDDRVPRRIRYSVTLMETAMALVRRGLGVAYLPEFVVERHNRIVRADFSLLELPLPARINRMQSVFALKRKDREEVASFQAICRVLRALR